VDILGRMERASGPTDTGLSDSDLLEAVRTAGATLRLRTAQVDEAGKALDEAVQAARDAQVPWSELAAATGMTDRHLQWRILGRAWPSVAERNVARRVETPAPRPATRPGRGPGVNIKRAAEILGVARSTVYDRIEAGTLESTRNDLGQLRVLGLDGE
jgi:hypothetical protein